MPDDKTYKHLILKFIEQDVVAASNIIEGLEEKEMILKELIVETEWNEIFDGIHQNIDAVAFQDGHIDYHELHDFFSVNKKLASKYNLACWTNAESFDRDMPIKFLPIKFEKLKLKNGQTIFNRNRKSRRFKKISWKGNWYFGVV